MNEQSIHRSNKSIFAIDNLKSAIAAIEPTAHLQCSDRETALLQCNQIDSRSRKKRNDYYVNYVD
jgi:hypothetical protein